MLSRVLSAYIYGSHLHVDDYAIVGKCHTDVYCANYECEVFDRWGDGQPDKDQARARTRGRRINATVCTFYDSTWPCWRRVNHGPSRPIILITQTTDSHKLALEFAARIKVIYKELYNRVSAYVYYNVFPVVLDVFREAPIGFNMKSYIIFLNVFGRSVIK